MANVNVTIRMDETLKKQADELFSDLGLSLSAAINTFIKQAVREQRIPFEITRSNTAAAADAQINELSKKLMTENYRAYRELAK